MRKGYLMVGSGILALGLIVFFLGFLVVGDYETFTGQFARAFSPQAEEHYRFAIIVSLAGIVLAIMGFTSVIYGVVAEPT